MNKEQAVQQDMNNQHDPRNDHLNDDNSESLWQELLHVEEEQHNENAESVPAPASSTPSHHYGFTEEHQYNAVFSISQTYAMSPREGERYYLGILLNHIKEATSYREMKTVNGKECTSFREAPMQRLLFVHDTKWKNALLEGFRSNFVPLKEILATISVHCFSSLQRSIYNETRDIIMQNFHHLQGRSDSTLLCTNLITETYALLKIEEYLHRINGLELLNYKLP